MKKTQKEINERTIQSAKYMLLHKTTIRATAAHMGTNKSTIHKDFANRLPYLDPLLYGKVRKLLTINLNERSSRGGLAMKEKRDKKIKTITQQKRRNLL